MATSKKTPSKKFTQKVHKIVQSDIFKSIAVASVLLNLLFFISIFVLTSTDTFDRRLYIGAKDRYCRNASGARERAKELGSEEAALQELQVDCIGKNFRPFYNEALEKFDAQIKQ